MQRNSKLVFTLMATNKPSGRITLPAKKRAVVSYANLSSELLEIWKERYPRGYPDYMEDIKKIDKSDGTFFYAVTLEIPDAIYLVKVEVKIDDYDEVEKDIFGSSDDDDEGGETDGEFPETEDSNFAESDNEDMEED